MIKIYPMTQTPVFDEMFTKVRAEHLMVMSWDSDYDKLKEARRITLPFAKAARLRHEINGCQVLLVKVEGDKIAILGRTRSACWVDITDATADELFSLPALSAEPVKLTPAEPDLASSIGDLLGMVLRATLTR